MRGKGPRSITLVMLLLAALAVVGLTASAAPAAAGTPSVTAPVTAGVPFSFRSVAYNVRDLPLSKRPFNGGLIPRVDNGLHDAQGVRMRLVKGVLYDFPRGQATYGLANLGAYRVSGDQFFLDRALAQADRLVADRVVAGDAWFCPNPNPYYRHGFHTEPLAPPWYSALSQGRALLFLSRLAEVTGDPVWRDAADHFFAAFLRKGPCSGPYVTMVDSHGYYWLQEWPWGGGMKPDDTLNGHNSAAFGIYEYWVFTQDPRALALFRGAATTTQHYASTFRQPGWISRYCLAYDIHNPLYHNIHVHQLLTLHSMTGSDAFAHDADLFEADYPYPETSGTLRVTPGRYTAVRYSSGGAQTGQRTVTIKATLACHARGRQRFRGRGVFIHATSGPFAGYWLQERPGRVYLRGVVVPLSYDPARPLRLAAGHTYTAVDLDSSGAVLARSSLTADTATSILVDRGAVVNGSPCVRLAQGDLTGYWIKLQPGLKLH